MSTPPASGNTARGIALMIFAIFLFSMMDAMAKTISQQTDTVMAVWARYLGQTVIVTVLVLPRLRRVMRTNYPGLQLLRSVFLLIGTTCFFFGFTLIGLAEATAIFDINPVLVTLAAALVLKEKFGPRRLFGVVAALIGAMIIIRPGSAVFSPYAFFPIVAAMAYTGYAITTRFVGRDEDAWTSLLYTAAFGAVILSLVVPFFWVTPDRNTTILMLLIGALGSVGHFCLIRAFMIAEASILAPFAYFGLLFATIWGMLFFGEYPDTYTYLGALVIVGAGIYVWHRETQAARAVAAE